MTVPEAGVKIVKLRERLKTPASFLLETPGARLNGELYGRIREGGSRSKERTG